MQTYFIRHTICFIFYLFTVIVIFSQSAKPISRQIPFVGAGVNIGGTLLWDKSSPDFKNEGGLVANTFIEFCQTKIIYTVRLSWTGEFSILGDKNDEEQTELSLLLGKFFSGKFFFASINAGPSRTIGLYRKEMEIFAPGYSYTVLKLVSHRFWGLGYDLKGGMSVKIRRIHTSFTFSLQGNISKSGSYLGLTVGFGYRFDLRKK